MSKSQKARRANVKAADHLYSRKFSRATWCIYCGDTADTMDHVFPISIAAAINWQAIGPKQKARVFDPILVKIPCCMHCNILAGDYNPSSIRDKRRFIQAKLRKNAKVMRMWADDELEQLSPAFRGYVENAVSDVLRGQARSIWPVRLNMP